MAGLSDFLPPHAWAVVISLSAVAMFAFFIPPSVGEAVGLRGFGFIMAIAAIEFVAAIGIAVVMVYYRTDKEWGTDEYRFDP
jgi:NADH:ubiquinone oxidoreductase subunit K